MGEQGDQDDRFWQGDRHEFVPAGADVHCGLGGRREGLCGDEGSEAVELSDRLLWAGEHLLLHAVRFVLLFTSPKFLFSPC
jgi:hypothetical protein